ncbi:MAG TPA: hypothetical protein VJ875_05320 [Pyrinomonadaceae bacterium]|nr:hypothetical protein [Pyrinomonadaceae bacterium]
MKIITSLPLSLLLVLMAASAGLCQTTIKARTESGKEVILSSDGTWKYAAELRPTTSTLRNKPVGATTLFKAPQGGFGIWYDDTKWLLKPQSDNRPEIEFKLKRGDAYAIAIIEELNIPLATLKQIAIENAKNAAPDVRVVLEETRTVNNKEVLCMRFDGTVKGIPLSYYGYYYGGKQGAIQLLTFTGRDLFAKYEQELSDFLNGLEIF